MNIVILTGAGISAESGLATFRAGDGLWAGHRIEDVCTTEALAQDPDPRNKQHPLLRTPLRNGRPQLFAGSRPAQMHFDERVRLQALFHRQHLNANQ